MAIIIKHSLFSSTCFNDFLLNLAKLFFCIEFMSVDEHISLYITIALQNNTGVSYLQGMFHVKTVYVSGVSYLDILYVFINLCILAHCMLNKKIFVRDIE